MPHRKLEDGKALAMRDTHLLIGRILLSAFFMFVSVNKLVHLDQIATDWTTRGIPVASLLVIAFSLAEFGFGIAVAIGFKARVAAYVLAFFCVLTIPVYHDFWNMAGEARFTHFVIVLQYLGMAGGFLMLAAIGTGRYSVDRSTIHSTVNAIN